MPTRTLLLALLLAASAVAEDEIRILQPVGGFPATDPRFEVHLSPNVDAGTLEVEINGTPVPTTTVHAEQEVVVEGEMPPTALLPAAYNVLEARATGPGGEEVSTSCHFLWFSVDHGLFSGAGGDGSTVLSELEELLPTLGRQGPSLEIAAPTLGAFVALDTPFTIEGVATDPAGVADLRLALDGAEAETRLAALDESTGHFAFEAAFAVPGLHRIVVLASNPGGGRSVAKVSVYAGTGRAAGESIDPASEFLLTSHGLYQVGKLVEPVLDPEHLFHGMVEGQTIWKARLGPVKAELALLALGHHGIDLALGFEDGFLRVEAVVDSLEARTRLESKYMFVKTKASPIVTARRSTWTAFLHCVKSSGQGIDLEIDHDELVMDGLEGEIPGLPDSLVRAALRVLREYLVNAVQQTLRNDVVASLEGTLNKYFLVASGPHESEVLGSPVMVGGELTSVQVQDDLGRFRTRTTILATAPTIAPIQSGWLATPPRAGLTLTPRQDLTIAVSDEVLNQGLFEAFRSGAFHLDLTDLMGDPENPVTTVEVLGDEMGDLDLSAILSVAKDLPISIEFQPLVAPVLIAGYDGHDLILQAHELAIDVWLELEDSRQLLVRIMADFSLPLDDWVVDEANQILQVDAGSLEVGVGVEGLRIDFRVDQMPSLTFPFGPFENLVTRVAYLALPFLLEILNDASLSGLGGLPLKNVHVWGESDWLLLSGDLVAQDVDNGGEPFVADGVSSEDTKEKLQFEFCALVALLGGTPWEGLLDGYRAFRDRVLGRLPGGSDLTVGYYRAGPTIGLALERAPVLRALLFVAAVVLGLVLWLAFLPVVQVAVILALLGVALRRLPTPVPVLHVRFA